MCKVYTDYCGTSEIEHGVCAYRVDNPRAKARGLSLRTGAQTMLYLSRVYTIQIIYSVFAFPNIWVHIPRKCYIHRSVTTEPIHRRRVTQIFCFCFCVGSRQTKNLFDFLFYLFFFFHLMYLCQFYMDDAVVFTLKRQFHHPFLM